MVSVSSRPQKIVDLGDPKSAEVCVRMSDRLYKQHFKLYAEVLYRQLKNWILTAHYTELPDNRNGAIWKGIYDAQVRLALSWIFKCDAYQWCNAQYHCVCHDLLVLVEQHIVKDWYDLILHVHVKGIDFFVTRAMKDFVYAVQNKKLTNTHFASLRADLGRRQKELESAGCRFEKEED